MPNHVHIILVPSDPDGLRRTLAPTHRRYAGHVQAREKRTGHFGQGRYGAVAMDEAHLLYAVRYVSLNPVRAGLVERAQDWPWASTRARLFGLEDGITSLTPLASLSSIFQICSMMKQTRRCSIAFAGRRPSGARLATTPSSIASRY